MAMVVILFCAGTEYRFWIGELGSLPSLYHGAHRVEGLVYHP